VKLYSTLIYSILVSKRDRMLFNQSTR